MDEVTSLGYTARLQDESYLAFLDMLLLDLPKPKRVSTEVLVLGGERDTIFPPPEVHATAKAYGTTAVMFDGAHDLMLEPVWPEVAEPIGDWLSREPRGGPAPPARPGPPAAGCVTGRAAPAPPAP